MGLASRKQLLLNQHVARLLQCRRCPRMLPPPVSGGPILSKVMLVGQAPGVREPVLGRPFAWTAGRTLFGWFDEFCQLSELEVRSQIYFAAVCRCFPGKTPAGGDRVPAPDEIRNCSTWMNDEIDLLQPQSHHSRRQTRDRAISCLREAQRSRGQVVSAPAQTLRVRSHSITPSLRRVSLAPHSARPRSAP